MADVNPLVLLAQAGITSPEIAQQALAAKRQQDGLLGIAALRNAGFSDQEIFAMNPDDVIAAGQPGANNMRLGGGTAYLGPAASLAATTASYRLGRAQLANTVAQDAFNNARALSQDAANPYNDIAYLDEVARTGNRLPLNNPVLQNIKPISIGGATSPLSDRLNQFLMGNIQDFAGGGRVMIDEPAVVLGAYSRRPLATIAENGREVMANTGNGVRVIPQPGVPRALGKKRQAGIIRRALGTGGGMSPGAPGMGIAPGESQYPQGNQPAPVRDTLGGQGPGDLNGDNVINVGDQAIASRRKVLQQGIGSRFLARRGAANYDPMYDLNNDGILNSLDLFQAARWRPAALGSKSPAPVAAMAAGGDFGGFASAAERQAAINRLAATPGAAEAYASYDRQRAASPPAAGRQDTSFGASTDTQGARPSGDAAYNIRPDGSVQIVANPTYGGALQPGQSYKNVMDANGVGHWVPISAAEAAQLAAKANADQVKYWQTGGRNAWGSLAQNLANAGGRPAPTFGPNANLINPNSLQLDYTADSPGGVNAPRLYGSGPFVNRPGPHQYDANGYDKLGTDGPRVRAYSPTDESYLAQNPGQRVAGIPDYDPSTGAFTYPTGSGPTGGSAASGGSAGGSASGGSASGGSGGSASGDNNAQAAAAKLIAADLQGLAGVDQQLIATLQAGQVPGLALISPTVWSRMGERARQRLTALIVSSGQAASRADIEEQIDRNRPT